MCLSIVVICICWLFTFQSFSYKPTIPIRTKLCKNVTWVIRNILNDFRFIDWLKHVWRNCFILWIFLIFPLFGYIIVVYCANLWDRAQSGQSKDYSKFICCISAKHTELRNKTKDCLAWNQEIYLSAATCLAMHLADIFSTNATCYQNI